MVAETIRDLLDRDPFEPFRVVTASGESYVVRDPHLVALLKADVFIVRPDSERWTFVQFRNITAVETATNGRARPRGKGRR